VPGFFEDAAPAVVAKSGKFDLILVAGLLGEVEEPGAILAAAREAVAPGGIIHVNVPNAFSLHRRLARAMGLIADEHAMSDRNRALAQHRNYDAASLRRDVEAAGLRVVEDGGYFLKPFTHAQMEGLGDLLTEPMLDGLWKMGREMPDLASEIYVNAVPA
jgi:2-polyprenyl-3-methyl-5-hydroxy-6-metoxy-1,4-benzoquinol methylase